MNKHDERLEYALQLRGVRDPCPQCSGLGSQWYGNTSTWRHGIGGSAVTVGICDACWGSGDKFRHWTNLRRQELEKEQEIERRALTLFVDRIGASMSVMGDVIEALCTELDKLARGRKQRPHFYYETCEQLATMLREAAEAGRKKREAAK